MGWDEILEGDCPKARWFKVGAEWKGPSRPRTGDGCRGVAHEPLLFGLPFALDRLGRSLFLVPVPEAAKGQRPNHRRRMQHVDRARAAEAVMGKVLPRATGLAEVLWSGPTVPDVEGEDECFLDRLDVLGLRWAFMEVQPGLEGVPVDLEVRPGRRGEIEVTVNAALRNVGGRVRFESSTGVEGPAVNVGKPLTIEGTGTVQVDVVVRGRSTGVTESFPVAGHAAAHQPLELGYVPSQYYTGGGPQALADGRRGTEDFRDGAWQAVQGEDMVCTVDLGAPFNISALETQLYLYQDAWIFMPRAVTWSLSMDGQRFVDLPAQAPWGNALEPDARQTVVPVRLEELGIEARYVRMTLANAGVCPAWHDAATEPSWLFVDELVVEASR